MSSALPLRTTALSLSFEGAGDQEVDVKHPGEAEHLTGTKCARNPVSIFSSATIPHLLRKAEKCQVCVERRKVCEWHPCQLGLEVGGRRGALYYT